MNELFAVEGVILAAYSAAEHSELSYGIRDTHRGPARTRKAPTYTREYAFPLRATRMPRISGIQQNLHLPRSKNVMSGSVTYKPLRWIHVVVLLVGYVLLDWASFIHALYGLNITPWSPGPAIGLAFIMHFGPPAAVVLFVAIVVADSVIRDLPTTFPTTLLLAGILSGGYGLLGETMRRRLDRNLMFSHHRELLVWILLVILGTLLMSGTFVTTLTLSNVLVSGQWTDAFIRYWVGDAVGIVITMPLIAMLIDERGRRFLLGALRRWETLLYGSITVAAVWFTLGLGPAEVRYFYVVFLPMVWAALRGGLAGTVLTATLTQLAIIFVVQMRGFETVTVLEVQMLAAVLVLVGFLVGVFIDEQRRLSAELRQSLRLAAAGEMAAALAHELNQPLTAMTAYGAACDDLVRQNAPSERLRDVVQRMVSESRRTAAIVCRLRDFFRAGDTRLARVRVDELLTAATEPFAARLDRSGITLLVDPVDDWHVLVDRLQLEVLLRNLVVNAIESVEELPEGKPRWIRLRGEPAGSGRICISVADSGPGPQSENEASLFEPFHSGKASGLGLGLAIGRSIAEAHGGRLWVEAADHGLFKLLLPLEEDGQEA